MTMMVRGSSASSGRVRRLPLHQGSGSAIVGFRGPLAGGVPVAVAAILYAITKYIVIQNRETAFFRSKVSFLFIVASCGLNTAFIILKGSRGKKDEWGTEEIVDNATDGDGSQSPLCAIVFGVTFVLTAAVTPRLASQVEERVPEGELYNPLASKRQ